MRWALLAVSVAVVFATPAARADELTASSGQVQATLHVVASSDQRGRADELRITRGGATLFDARPAPRGCVGQCAPTGLEFRDLDSDGEPELVYHVDTGEPQCCHVVQIYWLLADASGYLTTTHDFGSRGYTLRDLDRDGRDEFVTVDTRFEDFRLGGGDTYLPTKILRYDRITLTDTTSRYRGRLRREARTFKRAYSATRNASDDRWFAPLIAWAADEYRLGHRRAVLAFLRTDSRKRGPFRSRRALIRFVDGYLRDRGYAP